MSDHPHAGDHPAIEDVDRTFCRAHCAAWITRKSKRGKDNSICAKNVWAPEADGHRYCAWTLGRIKELMR
ncbi:MAG: hypothetical protein RBR18_16535 [Desulfovibrionaceae bacterium]|nr:hypothetical protein [Desulfovibrionaceae bacterium]